MSLTEDKEYRKRTLRGPEKEADSFEREDVTVDAEIKQEALNRIGNEPEIRIDVEEGVLTVSGIVPEGEMKSNIEAELKEIPGVRKVRNLLGIKP